MTPGFLGCWAGWIAVRLVAMAGWIAFPLTPPPAGVRTHSFHVGYAKEQDFFWYAVTAVAGIAGAWAGAALARRLRRSPAFPRSDRPWAPRAGALTLLAATLLLLSSHSGFRWIAAGLAMAGALLPWCDRRWTRPAVDQAEPTESPVGAGSGRIFPYRLFSVPTLLIFGLPFLAVADPCLPFRWVDGHHEGGMLLYAVHAGHGEVPGLDFRPEYGPLFVHSFTAWMRVAGMVVASERLYFAGAQWLGAVLHLTVIVLLCRSGAARIAGAWLMLTVTTAPFVQYGWANGLRTALPLLGFACAWRAATLRALAAAGAVAAAGWWYSQEFGSAAIAGTGLMLWLRQRPGWRGRAWWAAGAAVVGGLVIPLVLFRGRILEVLASPPGGGMLAAKLRGSGSVPFPPFLGWDAGAEALRSFWWNDILNVQLWLPALLAGPAAATALSAGGFRRGRGPLLAGLAMLALLYQWPAVVRPIDQIRMCVVGALALGAVLLDPLATTRRWRTGVTLVAVLGYGCLHLYSIRDSLIDRVRCLKAAAPYPAVRLNRMGEIWLPPEDEQRETALVETIQRLCPPDGRVYSGAGYATHVLFLADRMALSPYPVPYVTQNAARRAEAAASLARWTPAVVLIERRGVDLPWEEDRKEEWDWIRPRYRKHAQFGQVEVWVPR